MIWDRRATPSDELAARYWDDLVRGNAADADDLDPAIVATIEALHARDHSPAPDPAFVARLRDELLTSAPAANGTAPRLIPPHDRDTHAALAPGLPSPHEPVHQRRAGWRRELAGMAVAAVLLLAFAGALAGVLRQRASMPGGPAAAPTHTAEIIYAGGSDQQLAALSEQLFVVEPDGSNQRQLTKRASLHIDPDWSADGSRIVFVSNRNGPRELYVMDADGGGIRQITEVDWLAERPLWSPRENQIVFTCFPGGPGSDPSICAVGADGSRLRNLSDAVGMHGFDPAWAPDGRRVAFIGIGPQGPQTIIVVNADGSEARTLATGSVIPRAPSWSPDGKKIAFSGSSDGSHTRIWAIDLDGGDPQPISAQSGKDDIRPNWSPDGAKIAFLRADGVNGVVVMVANADGSREHQVSGEEAYNQSIAWSPDGTALAFITTPNMPREPEQTFTGNALRVVSADGSNLRTVASNVALGGHVAWRPGSTPSVPAPDMRLRTGDGRDLRDTGSGWARLFVGERLELLLPDYGSRVNEVTYSLSLVPADGGHTRPVEDGGITPGSSGPFPLDLTLEPGRYLLIVSAHLASGEAKSTSFRLEVEAPPTPVATPTTAGDTHLATNALGLPVDAAVPDAQTAIEWAMRPDWPIPQVVWARLMTLGDALEGWPAGTDGAAFDASELAAPVWQVSLSGGRFPIGSCPAASDGSADCAVGNGALLIIPPNGRNLMAQIVPSPDDSAVPLYVPHLQPGWFRLEPTGEPPGMPVQEALSSIDQRRPVRELAGVYGYVSLDDGSVIDRKAWVISYIFEHDDETHVIDAETHEVLGTWTTLP